jgi:hypothetical protein
MFTEAVPDILEFILVAIHISNLEQIVQATGVVVAIQACTYEEERETCSPARFI